MNIEKKFKNGGNGTGLPGIGRIIALDLRYTVGKNTTNQYVVGVQFSGGPLGNELQFY